MSDTEHNDRSTRKNTRVRNRRERKVSSLTAQQVQHKRDLDRRAQRALRQRVKSRMQDLEDDLTRARADCSVRERELMEEVQQLREENRKLKSYLDSIAQFAQTGASVTENGTPEAVIPDEDEERQIGDAQQEPVYDQPEEPAVLPNESNQSPTDAIGLFALQPGRTQPAWVGDTHHHETTRGLGGENMTASYHGNNLALDSLDLPPLESAMSLARSSDRQSGISPHSVLQTWNTTVSPPVYQPSFATGISSVLPKHTAGTCPLDQILLDFISSRRAIVAKGGDADTILGSPQPSLQAILHPGSTIPGDHATSRVLTEILSTFPHVAIPERLGFMFIMYRTMRWLISPSPASYEEMPRWLRPTATQITVPHPAWIDNIPWPRVRDLLIESPEKYPFPVFSELYSQNVTVNWPYGEPDCITTHMDRMEFNPIFEKHVRKLDNWTVRSAFKDYLPEFTSAIYGKD
ncbi:hypothetical protein BJY04DRAFT_222694 [Aspergillus karnatakaensis]|uniref:uncharacterized protein n=1 Tax=Aspergillus karnatakaensis TaxID=1810916 RepID=UPI003CCDBA5C